MGVKNIYSDGYIDYDLMFSAVGYKIVNNDFKSFYLHVYLSENLFNSDMITCIK